MQTSEGGWHELQRRLILNSDCSWAAGYFELQIASYFDMQIGGNLQTRGLDYIAYEYARSLVVEQNQPFLPYELSAIELILHRW